MIDSTEATADLVATALGFGSGASVQKFVKRATGYTLVTLRHLGAAEIVRRRWALGHATDLTAFFGSP
jgi:hypothetical protein